MTRHQDRPDFEPRRFLPAGLSTNDQKLWRAIAMKRSPIQQLSTALLLFTFAFCHLSGCQSQRRIEGKATLAYWKELRDILNPKTRPKNYDSDMGVAIAELQRTANKIDQLGIKDVDSELVELAARLSHVLRGLATHLENNFSTSAMAGRLFRGAGGVLFGDLGAGAREDAKIKAKTEALENELLDVHNSLNKLRGKFTPKYGIEFPAFSGN